jgi:tetratricopeptide (TPR) repeat protein
MRLNDSIQAYSFAKNALKKCDSVYDIEGYLIDSNQLGRSYDYFRNYNKAIEAYSAGINKYENSNSENQKIEVLSQLYLNLSQAYEELGQIDKAIDTQLKGVKYAEKINYPTGIAFGLYSMGWTYMELKEYAKAEEYFFQSLKYSDSVTLPTYINRNHHALGINYYKWGKIDKALKHDSIALYNFKKEKNELYVFDVLNNISEAYTKKGDYKKAILAGNEALNIAIRLNHALAINGIKQTLANAYINNSEFVKAEQYIRDVLKDTINPTIIRGLTKADALENLSLVLEKNNNHKSSLKYYKKFKIFTDSINEDIRASKFADIETKYQTEKNEKEILKLRADKAEQDLLRQEELIYKWSFAGGLVLTSLLCLLLIYYLIKRKRQLKIEQYKYTQEVNRLKKLKESQQQKIIDQSKQIDNLHQTIQEKEEFSKTKFIEKENQFHESLAGKYNLSKTKVLLQYWIDQSNGLTEKEMMKLYHKSAGGVEGRRKRLYEKIKVIEDIDSNVWLSREEATRIYRENWQDFNK